MGQAALTDFDWLIDSACEKDKLGDWEYIQVVNALIEDIKKNRPAAIEELEGIRDYHKEHALEKGECPECGADLADRDYYYCPCCGFREEF